MRGGIQTHILRPWDGIWATPTTYFSRKIMDITFKQSLSKGNVTIVFGVLRKGCCAKTHVGLGLYDLDCLGYQWEHNLVLWCNNLTMYISTRIWIPHFRRRKTRLHYHTILFLVSSTSNWTSIFKWDIISWGRNKRPIDQFKNVIFGKNNHNTKNKLRKEKKIKIKNWQ